MRNVNNGVNAPGAGRARGGPKRTKPEIETSGLAWVVGAVQAASTNVAASWETAFRTAAAVPADTGPLVIARSS